MKKTSILVLVGIFLFGSYCPSLGLFDFSSEARAQNEESQEQTPPETTYEDVEKKIKELIEVLEKLKKDAGHKLRKDVVPRLEKELDKLKEWLHDFRMDEKDQPTTRET